LIAADSAGFLGLLMGRSLLSLIEIIYHFTLQKIFRSHNKEKHVDEDEKLNSLRKNDDLKE
jgi:hypothetical protein